MRPTTVPSQPGTLPTANAPLQFALPTMRPSSTLELPTLTPAQQLFANWAGHQRTRTGEPLSDRSILKYESVWCSWLRHLALEGLAWDQARPENVQAFLNEVHPSSPRHTDASEVSRRRYWSILDDIYAHAVTNNLLAQNPARILVLTHTQPASENIPSVVLQPLHLQQLREYLSEHQFTPDDTSEQEAPWNALRDRALIAVLLDVGLTTSELIQLRHSQVSSRKQEILITIDGQRAAQRRTLALSSMASAAIRAWMRHHMNVWPRPDHVFFSRKGHGPFAPPALFLIVNKFLRPALKHLGLPHAQHQGPSLIRGSVINSWLKSGMPAQEVVAKAGLLNENGLRRLIHPD